jgi:gamma-glutamyltranspeptidase
MPGHHDSIAPASGRRACPTIVFRGGRPLLAIVRPAVAALVSAVFQTLLNIFVHGMNLRRR